jgi:hypothetical protein
MFINFHNQQRFEKNRYSKSVLVSVLEALETKNQNKIADLTAAFGETVAVDEVLHLFSDKMAAMRLFSTFEAEAKPGPDPYMRDLDDEEKEDKEEQMKDQAEMDDDDPEAYQEMPGDEEAREKGEVKTSKHTKAYDKIYSDDEETNEAMKGSVKKVASALRKQYDGQGLDFIAKVYQDAMEDANFHRELDSARGIGAPSKWKKDVYSIASNIASAAAWNGYFIAQGTLAFLKELGEDAAADKFEKYLVQYDLNEARMPLTEAVDTDTVVQIELEDGIYYIKPYGDSTHFYISTMKDGIGNGIPAHIGQYRNRPFYSDLRKYLKGGADIDGNSYVGESYVSEGKDDYMARYGKTDIMIKKGYKVADEGDLEDLYVKLGELAAELGFGVKNITVVTEGKTTWQDIMEHIESIGEGDEQSDEMAYGQLERCIDYAKMLRDRYDQGFTFDSWMYGKITKAKDYLNTVFDALDGGDGEIEESSTNESLKNDVKKYIKQNQEELDNLADADQWDQIYNMLYTDFDVEPDSDDAQELKTVFSVTY